VDIEGYYKKGVVKTEYNKSVIKKYRDKQYELVAKLEEQLALCQAQAEGKRYVVTKAAWTRDDSGNKLRVQKERMVKPWYWQDGEGLSLVVRYGARILDLSKGKRAISVNTAAMLPGALNTLIAAVKAGELDAAISAVIGERKLKLPSKG
jgi:hypothetical protein